MSLPSATPESSLETLIGVLERILYTNEENHYCVGELSCTDSKQKITLCGTLPSVQCGETLKIQGSWTNHLKYGPQFRVISFQSQLPSSLYGIRKYLGSGLIPGIGKTYADKIVDQFKEQTFTVISEESIRLKEIAGIGPQRAKSIKKAWEEQRNLRDVFLFLKTYGVTNALCLRIVKKYGNEASNILKANPYAVAREIDGIGFKTADKIALNLGLPNDSAQRLDAGILHVIKDFKIAGHTAVAAEKLILAAHGLLESPPKILEKRLESLIKKQSLILTKPQALIQIPKLSEAEHSISQALFLLLNTPSHLPPIQIDKAIEWAQKRAGFGFASEQLNALHATLTSKVSILTGGPGTGKTTILKALVDILCAKKVKILLAAPTGRAAQRMSESANHPAQTIHRLLKFEANFGSFVHKKEYPLDTHFIILDEASMIDTPLASSLLDAIPPSAHLLLVGDTHQLPSIGPGSILNDFIRCHQITTTALNQIFRQQKQSSIVTTAHNILNNNPQLPKPTNLAFPDPTSDFFFIPTSTPEQTIEQIASLITTHIPQHYAMDSLMDLQVLAPLHKGIAGIININQTLQKQLNNSPQHLQIGFNTFKLNDKVIQTRNNYDKNIFNGDLGKITQINHENATVTVNFDGNLVELERLEVTDLSLAYAISIHKSQGSEFPFVIIPLLKGHFVMLQRNLIYTAITRARKKVFLVGDPIAYSMAVRNNKNTARQTDLLQKIQTVLNQKLVNDTL